MTFEIFLVFDFGFSCFPLCLTLLSCLFFPRFLTLFFCSPPLAEIFMNPRFARIEIQELRFFLRSTINPWSWSWCFFRGAMNFQALFVSLTIDNILLNDFGDCRCYCALLLSTTSFYMKAVKWFIAIRCSKASGSNESSKFKRLRWKIDCRAFDLKENRNSRHR